MCPTPFVFHFLIYKVFSIDAPTAEKLKGWVGGGMTAFMELLKHTLNLSPTLLILLFPLPKSLSNGLLIVKIPKGREGGEITASASSLTYLSEYLTQWSPQPWFHFSLTHKFLSISARRVKELKGCVRGEIISFVVADLLTWILDSAVFWYLHTPPPPSPLSWFHLIHKYLSIGARRSKELKGWVGCGVTDVNTWISGLLVPPPQPIDFTFLYSTNSYQVVRGERKMKGRVGGKIISFVVADLLTWRRDTAVFGYPHPTPLSWFFSTILRKFLSISARRTKNWRDGSIGK